MSIPERWKLTYDDWGSSHSAYAWKHTARKAVEELGEAEKALDELTAISQANGGMGYSMPTIVMQGKPDSECTRCSTAVSEASAPNPKPQWKRPS